MTGFPKVWDLTGFQSCASSGDGLNNFPMLLSDVSKETNKSLETSKYQGNLCWQWQWISGDTRMPGPCVQYQGYIQDSVCPSCNVPSCYLEILLRGSAPNSNTIWYKWFWKILESAFNIQRSTVKCTGPSHGNILKTNVGWVYVFINDMWETTHWHVLYSQESTQPNVTAENQ